MSLHTPDATAARRASDRLTGPLAAVALAAAVIALAVPLSGRSPDAVGAAAALSDPHPVTTPARVSAPASAERVPFFFGFLEYDWDPDAPGGVPGFDPWPMHHRSVVETSLRN